MANYSLYIDITGGKDPNGYFEITPISIEPFNESQLNKMPVLRNEWGVVKVKNQPYDYFNSGGLRYNLYDVLLSVHPTQQINIKFVSDYETIYGYFGLVDCKLSEDKNIIDIQPTILDQYTPFVENYDKEIRVFEGRNVVVNGDFRSFVGNNPVGWTKTTVATETYPAYFKDKTAIRIPSVIDILNNTGINQTFTNVNKGKNLTLILQYLLIGSQTLRENLKFKCHLQGSVNSYDLTESGKWIPYTAEYKAVYKNAAVQLTAASVDDYMTFQLVSESIPEAGTITFYLFHDTGYVSDLYFSKVKIELSAVELKTINVNLDEETLVTLAQTSLKMAGIDQRNDEYFLNYGGTTNENINYFDCNNYFNADGSPKTSVLNSGDTALKSAKKITYGDLLNIMDNDQNSSFYQGEMSELTVFRGEFFRDSPIFGKRKRLYYGQAKFTREEVYIQDLNDEYGNPIPPQENVGWRMTQTLTGAGERLWVRKPYGGAIDTWVIGTKQNISISGKQAKITSKRNYPISDEKTFQYKTGVDLRELIKQVYQSTDDSLIGKNVYSTFFWNDEQTAEIEAKIFTDGVTSANYVSGINPNPLNNILAIHTSDLSATASLDEEKSVLKISGRSLWEDLKVHFPKLYFYIDADYNLHIEHEKFFEKTRSYKDITSSKYDYLIDYRQFEFVRDEMYSLEKYEIGNSGYQDFKTAEVTFDKIVSNKRKEDIKIDRTANKITTDLQYCVESAASLSSGILLVAYDVVDGENIARHGIGRKTGKNVLNGDLSIASLLYNYARYSGTWKSGQINGVQYTFENTTRTKKGAEIELKGVVTENEIKTKLGNGVVVSKIKDYNKGITTLSLAYQFDVVEISNGGDTILDTGYANNTVVALGSVITGAVNVYELSGEYNILVNSNAYDDGDSNINEKGICFGTSLNPTTADTKQVGYPATGVGTYIAGAAGLASGTYYLRAYAINAAGTAYGSNETFIIP